MEKGIKGGVGTSEKVGALIKALLFLTLDLLIRP